EGPTQDANAGFLVIVLALDVADRFERAQQRDPAAGDDAFFDGGTRGVQRVFDAGLLFLHLDFGGSTDLDQGHAAGQLGDPLLQLFLVVVGGGFLDLGADLLDPGFDVVVGTGAVDDGGVFLGQLDLLGLAEVFQGDLFQAHAEVFGDDLAAGEHRHVFEHGLAPVTKAGRLGGGDLDDAAHVVDHQRGQRFAFHVFGNDHQRAIGLGDVLQQRQHVADVGDLLVVQKNVGVLQFRLHGLAVGDEVRRQVATVELHAFDHVEFVVQAG